jgi:hypothetical protein
MAAQDAARALRLGGLASIAVIALVAAAPPSRALPALLSPSAAADPAAPLVALIALVAWALLVWLSLVGTVTLAGGLPGVAGRAAAGVARRIAPAAVRRLVALALGATLTTGVAGSATAYAAPPGPPGPGPVAASLDWPTAAPTPELDWAAAPVAAPQVNDETVVVGPGDSLWAIAAAHLPDDAPEVAVAQAWPAWWAANRDAVGPDPGLIHPGLQLTPPSSSTSS